jgi:hypothetical protein
MLYGALVVIYYMLYGALVVIYYMLYGALVVSTCSMELW